MSYKPHFSRFLGADPGRLHAAAHSHHPWPDVSLEAHTRAWTDAARLQDDKWDHVFDTVLPEARGHIAGRLGLPDPSTVTFAPNTHEFVVRILSCLPSPARVLTTDGEFHSFTRQLARWEEAGRVIVDRVPAVPLATLTQRLIDLADGGRHDLVFVSHVLFDWGQMVDVDAVTRAVPSADTFVVVDAYHGFMAVPTDFGALAGRAFYLAGGYKYAMAGEGACFLHCPPGYGPRPVDTGWYAGFGELQRGPGQDVGYPADGGRFMGATFDPSGLYRFNAVQRWLDDLGISVADIHAHVEALQQQLLDDLDGTLDAPEADPRGHFLSFAVAGAAGLYRSLHARGVVTDYRGNLLRIGLGLYHDADDVTRLVEAMRAAVR